MTLIIHIYCINRVLHVTTEWHLQPDEQRSNMCMHQWLSGGTTQIYFGRTPDLLWMPSDDRSDMNVHSSITCRFQYNCRRNPNIFIYYRVRWHSGRHYHLICLDKYDNCVNIFVLVLNVKLRDTRILQNVYIHFQNTCTHTAGDWVKEVRQLSAEPR